MDIALIDDRGPWVVGRLSEVMELTPRTTSIKPVYLTRSSPGYTGRDPSTLQGMAGVGKRGLNGVISPEAAFSIRVDEDGLPFVEGAAVAEMVMAYDRPLKGVHLRVSRLDQVFKRPEEVVTRVSFGWPREQPGETLNGGHPYLVVDCTFMLENVVGVRVPSSTPTPRRLA